VSTLSICPVFLSEIFLTHLAHPRIMLLPEVFQATHPNFDICSADGALYLAISDNKGHSVLVFLRARLSEQ
jgi:hypothetical protein